ncbi:hypothetical protein [Holophaga foetida]|uniref:hypothetical protein n=1 Tax=Holophaga foetida TaxID=35839 RepID=UPI0002471CDC|nr:hypothetical protein [Holophaga foetida]
MVIQDDGKIVVAGYSYNGTYKNFAVARYTTSGSLDTTFSGDGINTASFGSVNAEALAIGLQSDGKIVLAGYCISSGQPQVALARFTDVGDLDTSFGSSGKVTQTIGTASRARALLIDSSDNIIVGGYAVPSSAMVFTLARFDSEGTLDTDFGSSGIRETSFGSADSQVYALAFSGTQIVAAGSYNSNFALARYTSVGSLDTGFSSDGMVTESISTSDDHATSVVIQSDGKIVAGGGAFVGTSYRFALVRYTTAGALDTSFGTGGVVTTDFSTSTGDGVNSLVLQSDGMLLAGGTAGSYFGFARYDTSGTLDSTFGTSGLLTGSISDSSANVIQAMAQQSDDKIVAVGYTTISSANKLALVRFYP